MLPFVTVVAVTAEAMLDRVRRAISVFFIDNELIVLCFYVMPALHRMHSLRNGTEPMPPTLLSIQHDDGCVQRKNGGENSFFAFFQSECRKNNKELIK